MAEALTARGLTLTQVEMLPEVLPTVDPELGALVRARLTRAGVQVVLGTRIESIAAAPPGGGGRLRVRGTGRFGRDVDLAVVVTGVRPDTALAATAGVRTGQHGALVVDERMRTGVEHVWAAGDCVLTGHRLLGPAYLPLGTTAHKQGRTAGENAACGHRRYPGCLGTQGFWPAVFGPIAPRRRERPVQVLLRSCPGSGYSRRVRPAGGLAADR
jgi:NADPH-dependent 2,4-dienoyl-CoA reductase/sulfur reductase-like enzyme